MKNKLHILLPLVLLAVIPALSLAGCGAGEPTVTEPTHTAESPTVATDSPTLTTVPTEATVVTDPTADTEPSESAPAPSTAPTEPETTPAETQPTECSHSWSAWKSEKAATCTTDGAEERSCSKCGEKEQRTIAAAGHKWDQGHVTKPAGECSETGTKTYTCTACSKTKTEQIPGNHTFGKWTWEEYDYTVDYGKDHPGYVPGFPTTATYTSRHKIHTCSKCGYQEDDGTPDHSCQRGSKNRVVTTVKKGVCGEKDLMRSTCSICGWYEEYNGRTGEHPQLVEKIVHLTDYTETTNELDVVFVTCGACDYEHLYYKCGEGWYDTENKYYVNVGASPGTGILGNPSAYYGNTCFVEHPEWQIVRRDFQYDADGYVVQFTYYWWYNGERYSEVVKCGKGEIEALFALCGLESDNPNTHYTFKIEGTYLRPYQIASSG